MSNWHKQDVVHTRHEYVIETGLGDTKDLFQALDSLRCDMRNAGRNPGSDDAFKMETRDDDIVFYWVETEKA